MDDADEREAFLKAIFDLRNNDLDNDAARAIVNSMMPEHRAFLNAILERPDDDLARLVYADYLDETGDPERAEFIRVQIEIANSSDGDPRFSALRRRQNELQKRRVEWRLPIRGIQHFHRGFVESIAVTADWLIHSPIEILRAAPIRELRVINADNYVVDLARVPGLDRIQTLDLRNNSFGTQGRLARFLELAPLRNMTGLLLLNNQLWRDDVEVLVSSERAAQLLSLDLSGNALGNAGVEILARAERLTGLRALILRSDDLDYRDRIDGDGAEDLAMSPVLNRLANLEIGGHLLGDSGPAFFANAPGLPVLERIDLSFNQIDFETDFDCDRFFQASPREAMRVWNLAGSRVGLRAAERFAVWEQLETLRELNLEQCEWAPGARELLAESAWAYKIRMGNHASGGFA